MLFIIEIKRYYEIIPIFFEISLFLTIFIGKSSKICFSHKKLFRYLNFLHEGVLIISKPSEKSTFNIEFINEKAINLLEIVKNPSISFDFLNEKFQGFLFLNVKCHKKDQTLINLAPYEKSDQLLTKKLSSLAEILAFHDKFARNLDISHFQRLIKQNLDKNYLHSLNLTINRHFSEGKWLYFLTIKKLDTILELKEKNEIKTRLLSTFSHELKTPLNGSIPMLEAINCSPKLDISLRTPYLENSLGCLKLLDNTLSNILDYSLMISDQFLLNLNLLYIKDLISEVLLILKPQIKIKGLDFFIEAENSVLELRILSDYNRFKQILLNLLINAIQFTNKGEILLRISTINQNTLEFVVQDTGIGISEEKLGKLKEKLIFGMEDIQLNSTGSCLGLTISSNLILLLGKQALIIESKENIGTCVKFVIIDQKTTGTIKEIEAFEEEIEDFEKKEKSMNAHQRKNLKNKSIIFFSQKIELKRKKNLNSFKAFSTNLITSSHDFDRNSKEKELACLIRENSFTSNDLQEKVRNYNFEGLLKRNHEDLRKKSLNFPRNYQDTMKIEENSLENVENSSFKRENVSFKLEIKKSHKPEIDSFKPEIDSFNSNSLEINDFFEKKDLLPSKSSLKPNFFLKHGKSDFSVVLSGNPSKSSLPEIHRISPLSEKPCSNEGCEQILIVDDDAFNLFSLETLFKLFDFRCKKAINGKEAIEILRNPKKCMNCKGIRLILMDYQMPVMDGIEATKEIIKLVNNQELVEIPIIGCTAFTTKSEITRCFDAGMKDVVFKPINKRIIGNIVNQWLFLGENK